MNSLLKPILVGCVVFLLWPIWGHAQSLNLTAPNGGEVWLGGTTHTISWTYTNVDNIKIEYSLNNGLNWTLIIASYPTSALSYTWTVPCIGSNQVKVRITNTLQFTQDESNGVFTIPEPTVDITYPAGGEEFQTGTGQYITWQTAGVVTLVLQYSSNGGSTWTSIGNVPATNGYANWIAPSSTTSNLRVRAYNIESFTNRDSTQTPLVIATSPTINNAKYFGGLFDGYDMSSSLPDSILVVAPNGGEVYNPTSTTQIQWNFCDVNRVKIEYSIDNGAAWTLIATDVPADQLSYTWTIPNSPSNQCLVKVTGIDRNVFDVSDAVFTISNAFVQLVYPNGGESFGNSTGQYIEWDFNSVSTVKLEYSTDNGSSWTLIGTAPAANKYANWIAPASASNQCLIRISDNTVPALSDQSESSFAIVQLPVLNNAKYFGGPYDGYSMNSSVTDSIKVTSPNGGEIWTSASTRTITWTYKDVDNVIIEYSLDDGQSWIQLAQNIPASQLSYNWTIPTTPSYTCRVRVRDMIRDISDMSDQVFIIPNAYVEITYPNGGENYSTGSGQYIEWNYADLATIKLEYSTDNGNTWLVIGTAPAANKYANWVAPSSASTQMLIRATDNSNPIYSDVSNAVFTTNTTPTLNNAKYFGGQFDGYSMYAFKDVYVKVIKPNGGEIWGNGTTQQIRWATLNTNENLKVEYSIDNEQNWTTLLNDVPNSPVTYDWEIASPPSTICKVRATTMSGEVVDKSDDFFTIANPSGILTNPISGNQFCSGESTVVTYSSGLTFNPGNRFIVQLSDSVGTFSGSLINIGEVTSTIPVPITVTFPVRYYTSSLYRLRVIATNTPTLGTNNGTNFTINPLPLVNLGPDRSICAGASTVLNALNSNSTYVWSTGATTSSISASTAGTYSVQVTNACGTSRDTIQIGVINVPTVYLGADTLICQNSVLQLRADSADVSYAWSTGSTSQSINVVVPGTYSVTVSNTCGSATDLITIGNLAPIQVNLGPDRGICSGESVTLNAGTSNASYSWSTGANTPSITVSNPGTYSVNVNNGCGIVSDQITLFNGAFQVNAGIDRTICNGESVQLTATGANAYSWNTGQTTSSITVSPTATTTYTVSATNIYNCTSTDAVVVNVNTLPVATSTLSGPATYCANQPSVLQANAGTGLNYQWQLNGANVSGATAATYSPTATGNYTVRVTNAQNCSATSAPQAITVLTVPSASITPSGNVSVCSGSSVMLQANSGDGLSYAWNRDGSSLSGANASSLLATQGGSYTVQVTAANGCFATSAATQITVNETPTISIAADGPVSFCAGGSVQLTATTTSGTTIQWEKDGVALVGATGATYTATSAGIYSARATSGSNCSSTSGAIVVTVSPFENVSQNETACGSFTWTVNGTTYNSSGQYTATVGCTNYTLNLTISGGTTCDDNNPCTVNDVILADCSCMGTFADADNDGTCDANDLCAGPEAGAACDDSDPCTVNDIILADCSCAGTFADSDSDGTCDANDLCAGAEPGTACNDNDPCTTGDIILADCSCAGTFADADNDGTCDANDNCAGPEAGASCDDSDPCTVNDIILADCSCAGTFADADNDGTCDANDLCAGTEPGSACDDNDPCTTGDIILADCTCAGTFTDADNDGTCDANDLCVGAEPGTACDDSDPCTVGDVITADCSCAGTFADSDNDGTCDANDLCAGAEPGSSCDDNNPCTVGDIILADCSCAGTFADADNDGTCDANDNCAGPEAGSACDDNDPCTINDIILADCSCAGIFADADNDGTCDANDNCAGPEAGTACDDNDPCTVGDVILADCSCAGTFADSDSDGTCDANDLCAGAEPGSSCDDSDPCTVGDIIRADCSCAGTFADADNDGTCDANDLCSEGPEPGSECNDRDDCTVDDMIQADCSCAGIYLDSDADGTCDAFDICVDGPEPGMTCDDGNPCTINDTVDENCTCKGTPVEIAVSVEVVQACEPYAWNGQIYSVSGNYTYETQTVLGCDSLARLALTVGTPTFSSEQVTNCGSYTWNGTTYSLSGTYTYVTTNSTGCPNTATLNLTVNNPSTAPSSVSASTNNVSAGTSVTLTVQGGSLGTGASWKWYRGSCGGTLVGTGASITITANVTDTYYVRSEGTCNNTACATITVNVLSAQCGPEVVSASSTRICSGSSTTLSVLGTLYPGAIWRWRRNSCSGTIVGTGANLLVSPTATTTYYVRAEGGTCGITLCLSITIIVDKMPATPSVISGPTSGLCNAQNVTYSVTPVSTVQQYNWTVPPGITIVSGQGTASVTVNVSNFINTNPTNGNPAICVTAQNSCGISPIRCLSLTTYPATPESISGPTAPCINSVNTYSCPAVFGATSYTWQVPTGWVIQSGQGTASITVLCNGTAGNVRVRANNSCGNSTLRSLACAPTVCGSTAMPMQLELWPNPTSDRVYFAYDEEQPELFEIYDMMGRTIYSGSWIPEFDVSGLAGGIYFVRVTGGGESVVKRMEVVR